MINALQDAVDLAQKQTPKGSGAEHQAANNREGTRAFLKPHYQAISTTWRFPTWLSVSSFPRPSRP